MPVVSYPGAWMSGRSGILGALAQTCRRELLPMAILLLLAAKGGGEGPRQNLRPPVEEGDLRPLARHRVCDRRPDLIGGFGSNKPHLPA
jgi:hypothetical protein